MSFSLLRSFSLHPISRRIDFLRSTIEARKAYDEFVSKWNALAPAPRIRASS